MTKTDKPHKKSFGRRLLDQWQLYAMLPPSYNPSGTTCTWTEAKVIGCKDGTLRSYYPRNIK